MLKKIFNKLRNKLFLNAVRRIVSEETSQKATELKNFIKTQFEETSQKVAELEDFIKIRNADLIENQKALKNEITGNNFYLYLETSKFVARYFTAFRLHQLAFAKYKDFYRGKSIVIVGAGPSVSNFKPIKDVVYIGLNRAFLYDKVKFDILFAMDKAGIADCIEDFFSYRNGECVKFVGDQNNQEHPEDFQIPDSKIRGKNIYRYITYTWGEQRFTYHIDSEPLGNFTTVSLQAMQFALFTNPSKIYLVGIDCTGNGHFTGKEYISDVRSSDDALNAANQSIQDWQKLKEFAKIYYPDTEIISVNPVNLRGVFEDWEQK